MLKAHRSCYFAAFALLLSAASFLHAVPQELRDPDVLYFDQNLPEKITITLDKPANIYLDKDSQTLAAALPPGTKLQIIGIGIGESSSSYIISTQYRGTHIEGWASASTLPVIDPKLINAAMQSQARREAVQKAIKDKHIIQGMTFDEVKQALGKPERASSRQDAQIQFDTWTFITYELVPQNIYVTDALGRTFLQTTYVKSPIGELSVEFNNGIVTGIEEHRRSARNTSGLVVPTAPRSNP